MRRLVAAALLVPSGAAAQTLPTIDTEDASLGSIAAGPGRFHPILGIDVRNGDFARGSYDDDAANLARLPVHLQLGFAYALAQDAAGRADLWLVGTSSNGLHAPSADERVSPRSWYESNNLLGVVGEPLAGLRVGAAYTIKASPNAVSGSSHEASLTVGYQSKTGLGWLHPSVAATVRPRGGHGLYTQIGVAPSLPLGSGESAPQLSAPLTLGIGWRGFYERGSGDRVYGSAGLALAQPLRLGRAHARLQASAAALIRDDRLRRLGGADAETSAVIPYVQLGFSLAL